jgi:hypothetical protein
MTESTGEAIRDPIHRASYAFRREGDQLRIDTWAEHG